jgi:ABC-type nitrate/sulfonate/bicarbonate transport system permease component
MKHVLRALAVPILALLLWELAGWTVFKPTDTSTRPSSFVLALVNAVRDGSILLSTFDTIVTAALGFAIAAALGLALGIPLGLSRVLRGVANPTIEMLRPIPAVALIPLGLLIFGFGLRMEVMIIAFACVWPVLLVAISAVRGIEPGLIEVARVLELGSFERAWKIVLPYVIPRLFVGFRLAAGIALVVAVTVEIAVNPQGLGYALMLAQQNLRPDLAYGFLIWIGVLGWLLNSVLQWIERRYFARFLAVTWAEHK